MKEHQYLCWWIPRGQRRCYAASFWAEFYEPVAISHVLDGYDRLFLPSPPRFDVQSGVEGRLTRSVLILLPVGQTFQKTTRAARFPGRAATPCVARRGGGFPGSAWDCIYFLLS